MRAGEAELLATGPMSQKEIFKKMSTSVYAPGIISIRKLGNKIGVDMSK